MSSNEKAKKKYKQRSLVNVDFEGKFEQIDSPRSKLALNELGILDSQLFYLSKSEYYSNHPELQGISQEMKDKRYDFYEERRRQKIKRALKKREELCNASKSKDTSPSSTQDQTGYYRSMSLFDIGSVKREREQMELIKKQNIFEIKNMIDFEIAQAQRRNIAYRKMVFQKKKEDDYNKRQKELKNEKERLERQKEKEKIEEEKRLYRQQSKEYKQHYLAQMREYKEEEKRQRQLQKENLEKQKEAQRREEDFRNRVHQNYLREMKDLENKQKAIDEKNDKRLQLIEKRRQEKNIKMQEDQRRRDEKLMEANQKNQKMMQERLDKYNKKQDHLKKQQEEQARKRRTELEEFQRDREEKEKQNLEAKTRNQKLLEKRKEKILAHIKENNLKITLQKEENYKNLQKINVEKMLKKIETDDVIFENEQQLKFKNYLRMKNYDDKAKRVSDMQRNRIEMNNQKIRIKDEMREKKEKMMQKLTRLLNKGNYRDKEDIYKKVFEKEDLDIINSRYSSNSNLSRSVYSSENWYNKKNKKLTLAKSSKQSFANLKGKSADDIDC